MSLARYLSKLGALLNSSGQVPAAGLQDSGVTAGSYGSASTIPAITVDAKGRVTGVTTNNVSGGVTSLNGQSGAITNTSLYAIGSYVTGRPANTTAYAVDATLAGSSLYAIPTNAYRGASAFIAATSNTTGTNPAGSTVTGILVNTGTWRCVSPAPTVSYDGACGLAGLWVRIS